MSVSTIRRFWDKRSLIFKVLIVVIIMVPLGFYNFVGASLIVFDDIEHDDAAVSKSVETEESSDPFEYETKFLSPETESTLFSIDIYN